MQIGLYLGSPISDKSSETLIDKTPTCFWKLLSTRFKWLCRYSEVIMIFLEKHIAKTTDLKFLFHAFKLILQDWAMLPCCLFEDALLDFP